jgi:lipoprotein NlpI
MRCLSILIALLFASISMSTARADEVDDAIAKVRAALKKGDDAAALKAAEAAVKLAPANTSVWMLLGEAQSRLRMHDEAIKSYDKAYELDKKLVLALNQRGGEKFKKGDVKGSIEDFETFIKAYPKAYDDHWRYGISLYYAGKFEDGAKQFKAGEKAFGSDAENAFFHYICNARKEGFEKARKSILKIGNDGRVPMMKIYDMIQGKAKPDEVIETVEKAKLQGEEKNEALFYAHLYVGLNYEAEGNARKCEEHLKVAVEKHKIGHYMWDVGNVHLQLMKKK